MLFKLESTRYGGAQEIMANYGHVLDEYSTETVHTAHGVELYINIETLHDLWLLALNTNEIILTDYSGELTLEIYDGYRE